MRAHVLMNLLNELGKRSGDKMRGLSSLSSILSFFRNEFNKITSIIVLSFDMFAKVSHSTL